MRFKFDEESEYGQEVLELVGLVNTLMEPDRIYTKTEVMKILKQIRGKTSRTEADVKNSRKFSFFCDGWVDTYIITLNDDKFRDE